jgi:hypothetical protein
MDDVHFNTSCLQPPRKPEPVAPGLESKRNPFDYLAGLDRLVTPAFHQSQQRIRIRPKFFQGLAVNAGCHSSQQASSPRSFQRQLSDWRPDQRRRESGSDHQLGAWETSITFIQRR